MSMKSIREKFGLSVKAGHHIKIARGTYGGEVALVLGASRDLPDHLVVRDCSGRARPRWKIRIHAADVEILRGAD